MRDGEDLLVRRNPGSELVPGHQGLLGIEWFEVLEVDDLLALGARIGLHHQRSGESQEFTAAGFRLHIGTMIAQSKWRTHSCVPRSTLVSTHGSLVPNCKIKRIMS